MENTIKETLSALAIEGQVSGTIGKDYYTRFDGGELKSTSPIDGAEISNIATSNEKGYEQIVKDSTECFLEWRMIPAPKRGDIVREIGNAFRENKEALGKLVSIETGKILQEGLGEIQEAIDIADFAVGLSRQLYGLTMHSERPHHRMYEQWHPLGPIGVISAFNFPAAVWAWNAMIAAVCGDTVIWKPSEATPITALAMNKIAKSVADKHGFPGLFSLVIDSDATIAKRMAADKRLPLISATGSCRMGRAVGEVVAKRFGKAILELGGNNAMLILKDAELKLAIPAVVFGAVGTAGQRCTSTRRILIERDIEAKFTESLISAYKQVSIGNPLDERTLMGPLVNESAVTSYKQALEQVKIQGGEIIYGGKVLGNMPSNLYVEPTIVRATPEMAIVKDETFAPILYIIGVRDLNEALAIHNDVPQGLSSAIFTSSVKSAERFLSHVGSDCGIANVNIGTSGAEIGGAFGGEKDTGGGRESGSDSWKQYMRRQTNTINWSDELPLAQGIKFNL